MSSVLKPSGPLPPQVYWVRRLGVLVIAMLLIAATWVWLSNGHGNSSAATSPPATPTAGDAGTTSTPPPLQKRDRTPSHRRHRSPHRHKHRGKHPGPAHQGAGTRTTATPPLASPTGQCDPSTVEMSVNVADSVVGHANTATLVLTVPVSVDACTLPITPDSLVARITSGPDVVWSSTDCPDALLARQVVVRHDPATVYTLRWNGRRSTPHCAGTGAVASPGGYWVEAALVGGQPHKAYFDILAAKH